MYLDARASARKAMEHYGIRTALARVKELEEKSKESEKKVWESSQRCVELRDILTKIREMAYQPTMIHLWSGRE